ncbi:MAG: NAD(P)-dependent oxidoreductase [Candidatus Thermoplasmatota archaeon]|nr:NAD(P)-dependent oxidoreductase [Candidatus Thermoplasmatota archaeon]MCL5791092.1 NAD(P)-dependent oxidoreductase [Candidatus Thermoplasmatota archaeon]
MNEIGFVGLGRMGEPIVRHLGEKFMVSSVYNRTSGKIPSDLKPIAKSSPLEVAETSGIIFVMVTDSEASSEIVSRIIGGHIKDRLIVDMSTISYRQSLRNHEAVTKSGNHYVDCPVIGSVPAAVSGKLAAVAGGRSEDFSRIKGMLQTFTAKQIYAGNGGAGIALKLANNLVMGASMAALSEAIIMSENMGISLDLISEAFQSGGAMTRIFDLKKDKIREGNFAPEFSLGHQVKDLRYAMELAQDMGIPHISLSSVESEYSLAINSGKELDMSYILEFLRKMGSTDE